MKFRLYRIDQILIEYMTKNKLSLAEQMAAVNEYEREPVPPKKVKGFKSFVGMVASEHIAGTEFVIGPLFVLHGAAASDVFLGLLVGNILATLSWALVCAPAAVKTRLTIFYQLEKICGAGPVAIYNFVNGLLYCVAAAAMIGVSASSIGLLMNIDAPGLTDLYTSDPLWILIIFGIGVVITVVATFGFDRVSRFANIFAPWMPLVFLASGIAMLPTLGVNNVSEFWSVAETKIWTGTPVAGATQYTFWHILIFAWLCNSAMHIGLGDMSIYRYAKKATYGLASGFGMFIGHFMAWVASGILCAVALQEGISNPSPGQIAFMGAGVAGAICVVIAGWTTANPTIYRAGLAVQGLMPRFKRWKVTVVVGVTATLLACFPAIVSKLDQFLGIYALCASPVGAIVLVDIYVFPKMGLISNVAFEKGSKFNSIFMMAWIFSIVASYILYELTNADFYFFMAIPGFIAGGAFYLALSLVFQKKDYRKEVQPLTDS